MIVAGQVNAAPPFSEMLTHDDKPSIDYRQGDYPAHGSLYHGEAGYVPIDLRSNCGLDDGWLISSCGLSLLMPSCDS